MGAFSGPGNFIICMLHDRFMDEVNVYKKKSSLSRYRRFFELHLLQNHYDQHLTSQNRYHISMSRETQRTIVVTGAARGLGVSITFTFLSCMSDTDKDQVGMGQAIES